MGKWRFEKVVLGSSGQPFLLYCFRVQAFAPAMSAFRLPKFLKGLTVEQKVASVLLLALGGGGVVIGFLSFGANLRRPIDEQLAAAPQGVQLDTQTQTAQEEAEKHLDTDGDGLSDYDEINVYKTSPYLQDTDSDGMSDFDQVIAGLNPTCPQGKTCDTSDVADSPTVPADGAAAPPADTSDDTSEANGDTSTPATTPSTAPSDAASASTSTAPSTSDPFGLDSVAASGGFSSTADVVAYLKGFTAAQDRQLLSQAGLTADKLSALTDDQVKQLFAQTVDAAAAAGQLNSFVNIGQSSTGSQTDSTSQPNNP